MSTATVYPLPIVLGCTVDNGKVLLIRRHEPDIPELHGRWELPGGKLEAGEHPSTGIEREIREETGYNVSATEMLPFPYVATRATTSTKFSILALCYKCALIGPSMQKIAAKKVAQVSWVPFHELDPIELQAGSAAFIRHILITDNPGDIPDTKNSMAYVNLQSIDPSHNRYRDYYTLFEGNLLAERPYRVQTAWRRTARTWQAKEEFFMSRDEATTYIAQILRTRFAHRYAVTSVSNNFHLLTGIHLPPTQALLQGQLL